VDVKIPEGSKELYLVVTDGGDGNSWDHADWIHPVLYKENGDSVELTDLNWEKATAGWGKAGKNKNVSGGELNVQGKTYPNGIGTHANSIISFRIPEGCVRFKTFAGLDKVSTDQTKGATIEFMLFNTDPAFQANDPDEKTDKPIPLDLLKLGFDGKCNIRDLWAEKNLGTFTGSEFAPSIKQHGVGLYRVSAVKQSK